MTNILRMIKQWLNQNIIRLLSWTVVLYAFLLIGNAFIDNSLWNNEPKDVGSMQIGDKNHYDRTGFSISQGKGYALDGVKVCYYQVGYPLFLAGVYKVFGHSFKIVLIIQIILAITSLILFTRLAFWLYARFALIPVIFFFLNYMIIQFSSQLLSETLAIFLFLLSHYLFFRYLITRKRSYIIAIGVTFGFLILTRSVFQLFIVLLFLSSFVILIYNRSKKTFIDITIVVIVSLMMILPWFIRNYQNFRLFSLSSAGGYALNRGVDVNNNVRIGEILKPLKKYIPPGKQGNVDLKELGDLQVLYPELVARMDSIFINNSLQSIKQNPISTVNKQFSNISRLLFFEPFSTLILSSSLSIQRSILSFMNVFCCLLLLGGLLSFKKIKSSILCKEDSEKFSFILLSLLLLIYYLFVHSFFASGDARFGFYPLIQIYLLSAFWLIPCARTVEP
jgi:4-amino-4-deoxy-L-arabinose transferase-like glycosyltransferase